MKRHFLAGLMLAAAPAHAQMVQPIPAPGDASVTLSTFLRTLAARPRDLSALLGAGQAAIDVGDPNAALGFFARAEEVDPRNARAKAGLAAALVQLEKPDDALRLFGEAVSLGVDEATIASDRGLAYDLRGDNRRAQKDYALALRRGADDETTRRYALSLGISGDRAEALTVLDPLLRRQDQGAWRARAFILAMTGDVSGANAVTQQVMPGGLAASMAPFLAQIARLNPAERAHAVNFGTMPNDGQALASVQLGDPYRAPAAASGATRVGDGLIPAGAPFGRAPTQTARATPPVPARGTLSAPWGLTVAAAPPAASAPRPGFTAEAAPAGAAPVDPRPDMRVSRRIGPVDPARLPPEARGERPVSIVRVDATALPPPSPAPSPVATAAALPPAPTPPVQPAAAPVQVASAPAAGLAMIGPPDTAAQDAKPFETPPLEPLVRPAATPVVQAAAAAPASGGLAAIIAGLQPEPESAPVALPSAAEIRAAQRAAARKALAASEAAAADKAAKEKLAAEAAKARANPARLWVQVATGSNQRGLAGTWTRIRTANAKALKGYGGYSVPFKATNRVLAGPVKSAAEGRALINALAKNDVSATTYSSEAGQEVIKLVAQ